MNLLKMIKELTKAVFHDRMKDSAGNKVWETVDLLNRRDGGDWSYLPDKGLYVDTASLERAKFPYEV